MKPLKISFLFYSLFLFLGIYIELPVILIYIGSCIIILLALLASGLLNRFFVLPTRFTFYRDVLLFASIFFSLGVGLKTLVSSNHQQKLAAISEFIDTNPQKVQIVAKITETVKSKDSKRFIAELIRVSDTLTTSKIALSFQTSQSDLKPGDIVAYYSNIRRISAPKNVVQFDYQRYMMGKEIYIQSYITDYDVLGEDKHWRYQILNVRRALIEKINGQDSPLTEEAKGLLVALLLGEKSYIDADVVTQFKDVGVMHILAISGLHVGLIYLVLMQVFFFLPPKWKRIAVLVVLWVFVFLSGFSPSVFRAVFMFSIFTICQLIRREQNLEHSIGLALFFGLCIYPYWVYDIGFQLSYLAVISIVYFLPMFKNYYSKNKIVKYVQGIIYVSLSVQIGLIPIQLYYFHQFSFIFLLANLIVIPLATVLVIVGMLYLSTMWIGGVSNVVGWVFSRFTDLLYYSIASLYKIDYLSFSNVKISPLQLLFIITAIILVALTYYRQKLRYIIICLVLGVIAQWSTVFINENSTRNEVEVVIPYISGKRDLTVWVKEEQTLNVFSKQWDTLRRFAQESYVQEHNILEIAYHNLEGIVPSTTTDILVLDNDQVDYDLPFDTTIVIVANHPKVNFERMLDMRTPSLVVFHNSVPFWFKQKCMAICLKKDIPFHDIYEKGYWSSLL